MISSFEENKFYVMFGNGQKWSDYDGPFVDIQEAFSHMQDLCGNEYSSPEMINNSVMTRFQNSRLNLVKDDNNSPINGKSIFWKHDIYHNGIRLL